MDDGIINREHALDPWIEFSDADVKERQKDEKMLHADRKKKIHEVLEETKTVFKENFETKKALMAKIAADTGISDQKEYSFYIEG
jgi:hypothetical protein